MIWHQIDPPDPTSLILRSGANPSTLRPKHCERCKPLRLAKGVSFELTAVVPVPSCLALHFHKTYHYSTAVVFLLTYRRHFPGPGFRELPRIASSAQAIIDGF